ncbi:MAG: hypothetical protein CMJ58_07410 [Planctomycetaceae bacterium]|nr:hypothetical protein [Planctomycetaceae bacterium]
MPPTPFGTRTGKKPGHRRLDFEPLEHRLPLSANATGTDDATADTLAPYKLTGGAKQAYIQAALASVTTSAPADALVTIADAGGELIPLDPIESSLVQAGSQIGLTDFQSDIRFSGITGANSAIVVLDTGIDLDHPFFGPDGNQDGVADRIVYNADFTSGAATAQDGHGHGTHVTSIIASQDAVYGGIAPDVDIISLKVLNDNGSGTAANLEAALQWVVNNVATYNIVGVNMSLSFGDNHSLPATRPDLGLSDEIAALAAQDVIVASASGNSFFAFGSNPGVSYPAADPNSLSVGAVWDANAGGPYNWSGGAKDFTTGPDRLASFSQRDPVLTTVLAPGAGITAAAIGGGTVTFSGTSMASPVIAGAAILAQQLSVQMTGQRLSLGEFSDLISDTGVPVFDGDDEDDNVDSTDFWYRRVDLPAMGDALDSNGKSSVSLPTGVKLANSTVPKGGTARLEFVIANQGLVATDNFTTAFYLSADQQLDASDVRLSDLTNYLEAGDLIDLTQFAVPLPSGAATGSQYILVSVDDFDDVDEANEADNIAATPITVTASSANLLMFETSTDAVVENQASAFDYGQLFQGGSSVTKTFQLFNDGSVGLVSSLTLPPGYLASGFPTAVPPGSSAAFSITLPGSNAPGVYSGTVSIQSNDQNQNPFTFDVTGMLLPADDHGDNASLATAVGLPAVVDGQIGHVGDVDWVRFNAVEGAQYQFSTSLGTLPDSVLRLIAPNGTSTLVLNDNSQGTLASRINWTAPADGAYFLEVTGKGSQLGTYELSLLVSDDYGNSALAATPMNDPSTVAGKIESSSDQDWFAFDAMAGVTYNATVFTQTLPGAVLRLFDVDGVTELVPSSGEPGNFGAQFNFTPSASGTYYVVVEASTPGLVGSYTFSLTGDDDFGDDAANAFALAGPGTLPGQLNDPTDSDWFEFSAVAGARYDATLTLNDVGTAGFRLVDVDGATQLMVNSASFGSPAVIEWVAPAAGVYYIEVANSAGTTSDYEFDLTVVDDHGNDAPSSTLSSDPSSNAGVLETPGDVDWFALEALAGVDYRFEAVLGALGGAQLRLVDTDGVTELLASASPQAPSIDWTAPADGTYYIEVAADNGVNVGDFDLLITGADDHGDNVANATPIAVPLATTGEIETEDDADWFVVPVIAGVEYRAEAVVGTLPGAYLRVFGPDGVTEIGAAMGVDAAPAGVNFVANSTGDYYIEIEEFVPTGAAVGASAAASTGGSYQVSVSAVSRLPGDYNGDQQVNGSDFLAWQRDASSGGPAVTPVLDTGGFESFAPGDIVDQFGWKEAQYDPGNASVANVQSTVVANGSQAVQVDRVPEGDKWWASPLGASAPTGQYVFVEWDMRVTATGATNNGLGPFFGVQSYDADGGFGLLAALGLDATSLDVVYQREGDGVLVEAGRKVSSDTWYQFALLIDFTANEFTVYFEEQPLHTGQLVDLNVSGANLSSLTDADIVALPAQGAAVSQQLGGTAYVDNFRIYTALSADPFPADGNDDGSVDAADLNLWQQSYGVDYRVPAMAATASVVAAPTTALAVEAVAADAAAFPAASQPVTLTMMPTVTSIANAGSDTLRIEPLSEGRGANSPTERPTRSFDAQLHDEALRGWRPQLRADSELDAMDAAAESDESAATGDEAALDSVFENLLL